MVAEVAARAKFVLEVDGKKVPVEVRKFADQAAAHGDKAGKDFADRFDRGLTPRMRETANRLGPMLNDALSIKGDVLRRNEGLIRTFGKNSGSVFDRLADRMTAFGVQSEVALRNAFGRGGDAMRDFWDGLEKDSTRLDKLNLRWGELSHNAKQWTLIIGAVLAGMSSLASLSSAAGAGILALGGGLSAAVLGGGALIAIFSVLGKDMSELSPQMRGVAQQFQGFKKSLLDTRDVIASAGFKQMPNTFERLEKSVVGLRPAFANLGTAAGKVFDNFSRGLQVGSAGFTEVNGLIQNAANNFPALANAAGTWTVSLMRGINKANPLVQQMIGYVQTLGDRFDAFTQSDNFDTWIANSTVTFSRFGELLDATGRALNDLVTPEAIVRTQAFLGNLTGFMPNLSKLLDILGRLDVFGLAAQLLNDFGNALMPLAKPAADLADGLNDVASIIIQQLANSLGIVAKLTAPLAQGLADVIDSIPPSMLQAIAAGVLAVSGAFVVLKGAQGIAGAVGGIQMFAGWAGKAETATGKFATALRGGLGKAGAAGIAIVGVLALADALGEYGRELVGLEDISRNLIAQNADFAESFAQINNAWSPIAGNLTNDFDLVLDNLKGFDAFWSGFVPNFGGGAENIFNDVSSLNRALTELDTPLAALAQQSLPAASDQFRAWAEQMGATDEQIMTMLNTSMPGFKAELEAASLASGNLATDQNLVDLALGRTKIRVDDQAKGLHALSGQTLITGNSVEDLTNKIRLLGERTLSSRDASRNYEQAIDDLEASLAENGKTLDITTEQGRRNEAQIDLLAEATMRSADETRKMTGDQDKANGIIAQGREELIKQLEAFDITGQEAQDYADKLGLIVPEVSTQVNTPGLQAAKDGAWVLEQQIRRVPREWSTTFTSYNRVVGPTFPKTAIGGTFNGAQARIIGEAGPEAVVPLNRPLGQVDPSVRWLSAIAQGKGVPAMAGGGVGGTGKSVTIEAGAIVVQGAEDPRRTAIEVMNEIADRIGS
ncbi:tape measure protein [Microbacterium phage Tempo]|nr:tape measure protein [Microbacterium phage Tempo]